MPYVLIVIILKFSDLFYFKLYVSVDGWVCAGGSRYLGRSEASGPYGAGVTGSGEHTNLKAEDQTLFPHESNTRS